MATERLSPDVLQDAIGLTGTVSAIQDDPDSPDGNWLTATSNSVNVEAHVTFPTPTGTLTTGAGLQEFRVLVAPFDAAQTGDPTVRVEIWENGGWIRNGDDVTLQNDGGDIVLSLTWDASELTNTDGSLVECKIVGTKVGGAGGARNTTNIGAIEWNVTYESGATAVDSDHALLVDYQTVLAPLDIVFSVQYSSDMAADRQIIPSWQSSLAADAIPLPEWTATAGGGVNADHPLPLSWQGTGTFDHPLLQSWSAGLNQDTVLPAEYLRGARNAVALGEAEEYPILITTIAELAAIDPAKHYAIANDIDALSVNWTPLATLTGSLDGRGYQISNFNSTYNSGNFGLFSAISDNAHIRRLGINTVFEGITGASASYYAGLLIGSCAGASNWVIEDCWAGGKIATGGDKCGGLIGFVDQSGDTGTRGTISRCRTAVELSGTIGTSCGAFAGQASGDVVTGADNFADTDIATTATVVGSGGYALATGKTTVQSQQAATYTNWDFGSVWWIGEGTTHPYHYDITTPVPMPLVEMPADWQVTARQDASVLTEWTAAAGTITYDGILPVSWSNDLNSAELTQVDWKSTGAFDNQLLQSWSNDLNQIQTSSLEYQQHLTRDGNAPVTWQVGAQQTATIPQSWKAKTEVSHQQPMGWLTGAQQTMTVPSQWSSDLNTGSPIPTNWQSELYLDNVLAASYLQNIQQDTAPAIAWQAILSHSADIPAEWMATGGMTADAPFPVNWGGLTQANAVLLGDWSAKLAQDSLLPVTHTQAVNDTAILSPIWKGSLLATNGLLLEWQVTLRHDSPIPLDMLASLRLDAAIEAEYGLGVEITPSLLTEWLTGGYSDAKLLTEWLSPGGMSMDAPVPVEWQLMLDGDESLQIDVRGSLLQDATVPAEMLTTVRRDDQVPVSHSAGIAQDVSLSIAWLGSLNADPVLVAEWMMTGGVNADHPMPVTWSSIGGRQRQPIMWINYV